MKDNLGISIAVQTGKDNWERFQDLINEGYRRIELYNKLIRIRLADVKEIREISEKYGIKLSLHSMVQDLFCIDEDIAKQELYTLRGEIKLASIIGCRRIVFHIHKKEELSDKDMRELQSLVDFASNLGVDLALENNQSSGALSGEYFAVLVNKIKNLKVCLDIGHLNVALGKGYLTEKESFLMEIKSKIVQLHVSYNNGKKDEHKEIDNASEKYFQDIVNIIGNKMDFVIETKNLAQAKTTLEVIKNLI